MRKSENIRIAQVSGYVTKKRCRKQSFEVIQGVGLNNEEAIQDLKIKFSERRQNWKDSQFSEAIIFNGSRIIYENYSTIQQPLFPNSSDNLQFFEFVA